VSSQSPITVVADGTTEEVTFQRYRLVQVPAGSEAQASRFGRRLIHVGSAPDNDLVIDHPTVSRVHARLEFQKHGYLLTDLQSKNGTWVDGMRIREAFIPGGASLRFGRAEVGFELEEEKVQVALSRTSTFGRLIGKSSQMREIFALLGRVAVSDVTVLVEGESGTGKELVAEALHLHSNRRDKPFVIFDCSAVAPELIESELFGHVKGAFTGAVANRAGVFSEADGGTLFLDEIGELPLDLQPKLLRALESGEVKPVGGNARRKVDVRVIAATNRQLDHEIDAGAFRQDLYYRLAVIKVRIPPLRQRIEDIPLLVEHFLTQAAAEEVRVGFETMRKLQAHPWPGNVRELKNYVDRAVILADDGRLSTRHLSTDRLTDAGAQDTVDPNATVVRVDFELPFKDAKGRLVDTFERQYWGRLLEQTGGNISEAARRGGIHRKSLEYLLKKLDLR